MTHADPVPRASAADESSAFYRKQILKTCVVSPLSTLGGWRIYAFELDHEPVASRSSNKAVSWGHVSSFGDEGLIVCVDCGNEDFDLCFAVNVVSSAFDETWLVRTLNGEMLP